MPYVKKDVGAAANIVRYRLAFHMRTQGLSFGALSRTLSDLGYAISAARVGEAFNGYRHISVDELVAFATALHLAPGDLLLSESPRVDESLVEQTRTHTDAILDFRLGQGQQRLALLEEQMSFAAGFDSEQRRELGLPEPAEILREQEELCVIAEVIRAEQRDRERARKAKQHAQEDAADDAAEQEEAIDGKR